jgi:ankyrin repeat protein
MDDLVSLVYGNEIAALSERLARGADVNLKDDQGRTLLMHAVLGEMSSRELIRVLLQHGADVDAHDERFGWTALHFAAQEKRVDVIDLLVRAGAQVNAKDCFGNTPLGRAVYSAQGDNSAIEALLGAGGDPDSPNDHGVSPRTLAKSIANYDIAPLLDSD